MPDQEQQVLVFDVGGSHIASGLFSPDSCELRSLNQATAPQGSGPDNVMACFTSLADQTLFSAAKSLCGIAIAIPNPFDYHRGISYMRHKYQGLYDYDLRSGLAKSLGCDPAKIHFLNDADAFLIGELYCGAAQAVRRTVGITLGTGVGSAFAVDGKIVVHGTGVPPEGEIWNLPYRDGIVEDAVSARAIQHLYEQRTGLRADVRDIASLAIGDRDACATFEDFGRELAQALRHTCSAFRPEQIVIGGGISRAASLFQQTARESLGEFSVDLAFSRLLDSAPLVGAGIGWLQRHTPERSVRPRPGQHIVTGELT